MENQNLVESVLVGDSEGAFESFNSIIAEKLADALEVRKVQIASGIMAEEAEQIDELKASTVKSYLDKVYGSKENMTARDAKIAARMKASGTRKPNMGPVALGKVGQGPSFMRKKAKVPATNEEVEQVDEAQLSDAQKLAIMKEPHKAAVLSAMKRYQTVGGDINKLSAGHRTLVTNYLAKSGGLDSASRGAAMAALKSQAPKTDKM